ncbi:glycosyltransferase family 9 protein [Hymenobacter aerilatus]|uniref:Glycosyltransferase family 9 protein n=1 Tax=Hymenobacter aerilatus TaxID=2932251 RepID=A0A8T9T0F8_9BACT|nr:glycosyltransferase family 9 protein [Hymenobacter aerilatus]UOR05586.1 glycosyltransferase family 9 protein [Hymenobacter aerilatus]
MRVLVRLPNWLGDVVMSAGFVRALHQRYPSAHLHFVTKAELAPLVPLLLPAGMVATVHPFSKTEWRGPVGAWCFGHWLRRQHGPFAAYYTLPNSFSAALLGLGSGARQRVGYATDGRGLLLTHMHQLQPSQHRADQYLALLPHPPAPRTGDVRLQALPLPTDAPAPPLLLNFNSEAQARRMPEAKAAELIRAMRQVAPGKRVGLLGSRREQARNEDIVAMLPVTEREGVLNLAGTTDLPGLVALLGAAPLLFSTDSGPVHVANALGTPVVVCFGPGNEHNTGPYHSARAAVVRAPGPVPCGGCQRNQCRFGDAPPCLTHLDEAQLVATVQRLLVG